MENKVGKILRAIGKGTMIGGTLFAIILGIYLDNEFYRLEDGVIFAIVISIIFTEFVTGMLFFGFSEVIFLLQKNVDSKNQSVTNIVEREVVIKEDKQQNIVQQENDSIIEELNSYKELLESSVITQEEYDKKEKELFSMIKK